MLAIKDEKARKITIRYAKVYNLEMFIAACAKDKLQAKELLDPSTDEVLVPVELWTQKTIEQIMLKTSESYTEKLY